MDALPKVRFAELYEAAKDARSNTRKLAAHLRPKHVAPGDVDRAVEALGLDLDWHDEAALDALPKVRFAELYEAAKDTAKDTRSNTRKLAALLRPKHVAPGDVDRPPLPRGASELS